MNFPTDIRSIEDRIIKVDPAKYASTRNFKNGAVTRLSPYISRGVISTKHVFEYIIDKGLPWKAIEKLVQELAWRDYWQQVWIARGEEINDDLKHDQSPVDHREVPLALLNHTTGIHAVDDAIAELYTTGHMHNHMRMYVASIACNVGRSHWLQPARWMYSHLLDGDWASNALSWQWVAGSNAQKKYYANQDNINRYFSSDQKNTCIDIAYEEFESLPVPEALTAHFPYNIATALPPTESIGMSASKKTLVYNYYNLDPYWHENDDVQRVLLLEPSFFEAYPVHQNCLDFTLALKENIPGIRVFVGEFEELKSKAGTGELIYKEHPANRHYSGTEEPRDWMFDVSGYYPSFFAYWKRCKKQMRYE